LHSINEHVHTNLKYRGSHAKSSYSIYFKTFPILNGWSNSSDNVILI